MAVIVPFKALRPRKQYVKAVASLPYDVVSEEEAKRIAAGNDLSFLHVEKSDIDLYPGIAAHDQTIYDMAKRNLDKLIREGVLFQEKKACFYIYCQGMKSFRQYGIVGGVNVAEYETGKIKKHELTREDKEIDRILHVDRVNAHTGPVFVTYRARPAIDRLVEEVIKSVPEYDFVNGDGISHTVWTVGEERVIAAIIREFAGISSLYIADGHHRAAAAAAVARMRREKDPGVRNAEYENIMAVLFPHRQLKIMDYNRVVKDLHGLSAAEFMERCGKDFILSPDFCDKSPRRFHEFGMYLDGRWYKLAAKTGTYDESDPVGRLDVSILQERLLGPVLSVHDARTNKRIEFVGGIRGMEELERLVDSGEFSVAFALYPSTVEQLMEAADAGRSMPPKSTWFEPKLRSGIFIHLLE
ncbi:MAG TPA: DUF1015 family protein [Syntrophales bacterium]|nr:DUF1015 family protein [Syntrophales bacterium]